MAGKASQDAKAIPQPGSVSRGLASFVDDSEERDFREHSFADQRKRGIAVTAVVMVLPTLNLVSEIPVFLNGEADLGNIILIRILVVLISCSIILFFRRTSSQRAVENILTVYGLFFVTGSVYVVAYHPGAAIMAPTTTVALVALIYFFAPLQFPRIVVLATLTSVGGWVGWVVLRGGQTDTDAFRLFLWLASVNLVGFFGCNASQRTSRALFWERRELARQKALVEVAYERERFALNQFKQFAELIAHEFRNPLAIVKSKVQLMQLIAALNEADDPDALPAIERAVNRLETLFSQWLASDRLADGDVSVNLRRTSLAEVMSQLEGEAPVSHLHPIVVAKPTPDMVVQSDPVLLRLVLMNILDNAVKYSPLGGEIVVSIIREDNRAVIKVQDQGMGIAADHLDRIFDKYFRSSHDNGIRGFGIGLFLVRRIMELHGGSVRMDSRLGQGTTASLSLPLDAGG